MVVERSKESKRGHRYFPVRVKLSAVRDRYLNELGYKEVLFKYGVSGAAFNGWATRYKERVLQESRPGIGVQKLWVLFNPNGLRVVRKITSPNQVWVSDITYLNTRVGFVYLSLLTDAYSRKIVGGTFTRLWIVWDEVLSRD